MYLVEICLTGKLMHHSTVLLRDGSLLLCGGRASPVKPSSSFFQLRLEGAMAVWSCINLDPTSDFPEPRWRHTATSIIWSNGRLAVVLQLELCIMFFWFFIRNWRCCYHWRVHNKCVSMQGLLHVEYQWMENKEGRQCSFLPFVCVPNILLLLFLTVTSHSSWGQALSLYSPIWQRCDHRWRS